MEQVIHISEIIMNFLNDAEVGKRLESLRGKTSSRKIAMHADIDPSQYKKIEKGVLSITNNILNKLVSTYKWDGNFILYGGINVPRETYIEENSEADTISQLVKIIAKHAETINSQQHTIRFLAERAPEIEAPKNGLPPSNANAIKPVK